VRSTHESGRFRFVLECAGHWLSFMSTTATEWWAQVRQTVSGDFDCWEKPKLEQLPLILA
jgi:hypothetical protein